MPIFDPAIFDPAIFDTGPTEPEVIDTAFAEFLAWPDREVVVLVEATPAFRLNGWTQIGAHQPHVYGVPLPRFIQTDRIPGGMYQKVVGVRENATPLQEQAFVDDVNNQPLSWLWDPIAGQLLVRPTFDINPDQFAVYSALVTFYFASTSIVLEQTPGQPDSGIYYHPWLVGELPRLSQQVEDVLFGTKIIEAGDLTLTNGHGFWYPVVAPNGYYHWKNKRIRLFLGGTANGVPLTRAQYVPLATMLVEDLAADEERCTLSLKPLLKRLDVEIPITTYQPSDYPFLGPGVAGTRQWIGYGRTRMRPDLTNTSSYGIWTIADASVQTLTSIEEVVAVEKTTDVRTVLVEGVHYTADLHGCAVHILDPIYRWQDYTIEVEAIGKPLQTFASIVRDLLLTFAGVAPEDIDEEAFALAEADAPEELALWIKAPRSLASILSTAEPGLPSLERSVNGYVIQTLDGQWTCRIWTPGGSMTTAPRLRKEDFAQFRPEPKLETVFATTRVHYGFDHARQEWGVAAYTNPSVQYLSETTDRLDIHTYLVDPLYALTLAQRYGFITGTGTLEIEFAERGLHLAQALAGDRLLVTYDPAPDVNGVFINKIFELIRLDLALGPELRITGRLGDLRGVAWVGKWTSDPAPSWATASEQEKYEIGFWADDLGYLASPDPLSLNKSLWW